MSPVSDFKTTSASRLLIPALSHLTSSPKALTNQSTENTNTNDPNRLITDPAHFHQTFYSNNPSHEPKSASVYSNLPWWPPHSPLAQSLSRTVQVKTPPKRAYALQSSKSSSCRYIRLKLQIFSYKPLYTCLV